MDENLTENEQVKPKKMKISYLFSLAENKKSGIYFSVLFSVLSGFCATIPFVMLYRTTLILFEGGVVQQTWVYGVIAAISLVFRFVFQSISATLSHIGAYNALYTVRKKLCEHIGKVNLGFFSESSTGDIKKVLMEDVERLETFLAHQIPDVTVAVVVPSVVFVYLMTINIPMALILLIPIMLTLFIQSVIVMLSKKDMKTVPALQGRLNSALMQFVNGMPVMKAYMLTANSYHNYANAGKEYNTLWKRVAAYAAPLASVCSVIIESGVFFTVPLGGILYLDGNLDAPSYVFFIIMSIVFLTSYNNLMNFAQIFTQISAGLNRIHEVMEISELPLGNKEIESQNALTVEFSEVSFAYNKTEILHDVSVTLEAGTLTAFVGVSGAGKSTVAQLIPRFWDVTHGKILINGTDIKEIRNKSLMDHVSFVFQDAFMLEDTIYNNISIGKTNCTEEDVKTAAKAAQIHDFICSLPDGYQTKIGADGVKFSGGEKQRICIARAILKNSEIVIFDEATSFTDIESEHKIQMALNTMLDKKTTVMIAHRLHTIVHADKICVFDDGRIIEEGTHPSLLAANGCYAAMWQSYTKQETIL